MKWPEYASLSMSGLALLVSIGGLALDFDDRTEDVIIVQSEDGGGEFYLFRAGVAQEVQFEVINRGPNAVVITKVDVWPGNIFPPRVSLDSALWDGRPFTLAGRSSLTAQFVARRDYNSTNTTEAQNAAVGQLIVNDFAELVHAHPSDIAPRRNFNLPELLSASDKDAPAYDAGSTGKIVMQELFAQGLTFDGEHPEIAENLEGLDYYITFGGPCHGYLVHTLSVCAAIAITTADGNSFSSRYIGFGFRSPDLDRAIEEDSV